MVNSLCAGIYEYLAGHNNAYGPKFILFSPYFFVFLRDLRDFVVRFSI